MSAQHSYQPVMNRMENVSYLVLPTCTSTDRSAPALKSIQDCTFTLYWISTHVLFWQEKHSTASLRRRRVIIESVRAYVLNEVYRVSCIFVPYVGMWKLTVYFFFLSFFCWNWPVLCLCRTSDVQVWYSGRREVVRHITILLCRGVKFTSSILGAEQTCRGI